MSSPKRGAQFDSVFFVVCLCFVLSGFAALLYQTAWTRRFSIVFGTSELAIATVLAAYMGGLALGAALAARYLHRVRRPVLVYGLLEAGIGLGALLVPVGLSAAQGLSRWVLGGQPTVPSAGGLIQPLFYFFCSLVILAVPTTFMGATFPLLTRHAVRSRDQIGSRTGVLYALNTGGAVLGTVLCAFFFLPRLGLFATVMVGVVTNLVVCAMAVAIARRPLIDESTGLEPAATPEALDRSWRRDSWILPILLVSGAVSFIYEVLWTRLLTHVVGASLYAFATMLATFLVGITAGSAVASRFASDRRRSVVGFVVCQVGIAITSLVVFGRLDSVPRLAQTLGAGDLTGAFGNFMVAFAVLLPSTLFIGATFPFGLRIFARTEAEAGPASGRVYAWNTCGAILGAWLAGFVIVPNLGYEGTMALTVTANFGLAMLSSWLLLAAPWRVSAGLTLALGVLLAAFWPSQPTDLLRVTSIPPRRHEPIGEIVYSGVGRSATVLMVEHEGAFYLRTSGLQEAVIMPKGAPPYRFQPNWWMGTLPVLAHPTAKSMLVIGLGGAVVLEGVPASIETIDVVELEPQVIDANRSISAWRAVDPLQDPRVNIVVNDGRNALALTGRKYDVIVSQPSHPWTAGASHLYTLEFMTQVREHLAEGGVFVQAYVDLSVLKIVGSTLLAVFEDVRLYRPGALLYVASQRSLDVEGDFAKRAGALPLQFSWLALNSVEDTIASLALDHEGVRALCEGTAVSTDDHNQLATERPYVEFALDPQARVALEQRLLALDPLLRRLPTLPENLRWDHVAWRLALMGFPDRAAQVASRVPDAVAGRIAAARVARERGLVDAADAQIEQILTESPQQGAARALRALWKATDDVSINAFSAELPPGAAVAVRARQAMLRRDWAAVAALEPELAAVAPTDPAYPSAVESRIRWRIALFNGANLEAAREALVLVDELAALLPRDEVYRIRIDVGFGAKRYDVVVETVAEMATLLYREGSQPPEAVRKATVELGTRALAEVQRLLQKVPSAVTPGTLGAIDLSRVEATRKRLLQTSR
ncbi:MAG: fused MFS/spermidine synthase [Planctomycetota bacterium]